MRSENAVASRGSSARLVLAASLALGWLCGAAEADWPQWRGPRRDGTSQAKGLNKDWTRRPPRVLWKGRVGTGFSSIAVSRGLAFTLGNRSGVDTVYAFDAATGKVRWKHAYRCDLAPLRHEGGPFATPTVDGSRVYTLSKLGHLFCFDAASGRVVWQVDLVKATGTQKCTYGFAGSPLVCGKRLILNAGPAGAALEKDTGRVAWKSTGDIKPGHASPMHVSVGGKSGVLIMAKTQMAIVDPAGGRVLWQRPITGQGTRIYKIADPLLIGEKIFVSATYGYVSTLLRPEDGKIAEVWRNKNLTSKFLSPVFVDGHIVGGHLEKTFRCLDPASGEVKWEQRFAGNVIVADGVCLILKTTGELVLADVTGKAYKELARTQALTGKCWTMPALADGRVYCRNADGDVVCIDISGK